MCAAGVAPVSSKPPPPKAPSTYWRDQQGKSDVGKGKGEAAKGVDSKGVDSKGSDQAGKDSKGKECKGENAKGKGPNGEDLEGKDPKGERNRQKLKSIGNLKEAYIHRRRRENRTGGHRSDGTSTQITSGAVRLIGNTSMGPGELGKSQGRKKRHPSMGELKSSDSENSTCGPMWKC